MDNLSYRKIFVNFLKKNGCLKEYKLNSMRYLSNNIMAYINPLYIIHTKREEDWFFVFIRSFYWSKSINGLFFWLNINKKWKEIIVNKKLSL